MVVAIDTGFFVAMMKGSQKAKNLWNRLRREKARPVVSTLVIGELIYILYRESLDHGEVEKIVNRVGRLSEVIPVNLSVVKKAAMIKHNYRIPYIDSLIFATALHAGCDKLYTSDRNHMDKLQAEGVEIVFCRE